MQYRIFDSVVQNYYDYKQIFYELRSRSDIYDHTSTHDITYIIFNKFFPGYNSVYKLSRVHFVCGRGIFPHELFCNIPLIKHDNDEYGVYGGVVPNVVGVGSPENIDNHSYYMMLFNPSEISLFPDEVVFHFLARLDIL